MSNCFWSFEAIEVVIPWCTLYRNFSKVYFCSRTHFIRQCHKNFGSFSSGNPLASYPLDSVPSCVWGNKSPFSLPLHTDRTWGVDWSVRYRSRQSWPVSCSVLYCLRGFIENKVFTLRAGVVGEKISPSGAHTILETPPYPQGGGGKVENIFVTFEFLQLVSFSWRQRREFKNN